jgi:hypothetical protein
MRPGNFLRRVLKRAAIRAGIVIAVDGGGDQTTALNFQSLRRTSSTLFGARAKDSKSASPLAKRGPARNADAVVRHYPVRPEGPY